MSDVTIWHFDGLQYVDLEDYQALEEELDSLKRSVGYIVARAKERVVDE